MIRGVFRGIIPSLVDGDVLRILGDHLMSQRLDLAETEQVDRAGDGVVAQFVDRGLIRLLGAPVRVVAGCGGLLARRVIAGRVALALAARVRLATVLRPLAHHRYQVDRTVVLVRDRRCRVGVGVSGVRRLR